MVVPVFEQWLKRCFEAVDVSIIAFETKVVPFYTYFARKGCGYRTFSVNFDTVDSARCTGVMFDPVEVFEHLYFMRNGHIQTAKMRVFMQKCRQLGYMFERV